VKSERGIILRGRVTDRDATLSVGDAVTVAIRPERMEVMIGDGAESGPPGMTVVEGHIKQGTYLGDQTEYRVTTEQAGNLIVVHQNVSGAGGAVGAGPGDRVTVRWHEEANLILAG
jgi:ABC-type Fe3+/spermidine/putrescine transport system ATPase subunit